MKIVLTKAEVIEILINSVGATIGMQFAIPRAYDLPYEVTLEMVEKKEEKIQLKEDVEDGK